MHEFFKLQQKMNFLQMFMSNSFEIHINYKKVSKNMISIEYAQVTMENHICFPLKKIHSNFEIHILCSVI